MIYEHAWPIEDDSFTFIELITQAVHDLDERILPDEGLTRTNFPDFTHVSGWLRCRVEVEPAERSAA